MAVVVTNILTNETWSYAAGTNVTLPPFGIFTVNNDAAGTITVKTIGASYSVTTKSAPATYGGIEIVNLSPSSTAPDTVQSKNGKKWQN